MQSAPEDHPVAFTWSMEAMTRVPYQVFLDPAIYEREQERLFRGPVWNYVALHAFVNRCAHRGALVCRELRAIRIKQANLVGPAGLVSMEDGHAAEIVQQAIVRDKDATSLVAMGGRAVADEESLVTETAIRGFWRYYRELMGFAVSTGTTKENESWMRENSVIRESSVAQ